MLCNMIVVRRKKKRGTVPVYLNVYDLTPINGYAYWIGLGVYHSGVQGKQPFFPPFIWYLFVVSLFLRNPVKRNEKLDIWKMANFIPRRC